MCIQFKQYLYGSIAACLFHYHEKNANLQRLRGLRPFLGMLSVFAGMYFDKRSTI